MSTVNCAPGTAGSSNRQAKQDLEKIELIQALTNTLRIPKDGLPITDIKLSPTQSKVILESLKLDAISSETYLLSNELSAFNSDPEIIRALRIACEFVRAGEIVSDGMETNQKLAITLSNSSFYKNIVKRTGQVHLAASAALTFYALKTTIQAYNASSEGTLSQKVSATANIVERLGDLGGDVSETITEWRLVSNSKWLDNPASKKIIKGLHYFFSGAEILGKAAEHIRYLVDEDAPLNRKIASSLNVLLDGGGLIANTLTTQAAVKHIEHVIEELKNAAAVKIGKETLEEGDNYLKILSKSEIDNVSKLNPLKKLVRGGLIGAQIAFLAADVIAGGSSLHTLNQHQKDLLKKFTENGDQNHYKLLSDYYGDRFNADLGFFIGKTAIDVVFTSVSTALMLTGAGLPLALAIDFVGAAVSSVLSYAQQKQIENIAMKNVQSIRDWEKSNPGKNYFDGDFQAKYNALKPALQLEAKVVLSSYHADRAFFLSQIFTTKQLTEAEGLFYTNKDGLSSDRLYVSKHTKNVNGEIVGKEGKEYISLDQQNGKIDITLTNGKKQVLLVQPGPILLPGQVKWKTVDTGERGLIDLFKEIFQIQPKWIKENVTPTGSYGKLSSVSDINGKTYFFETKENEHLFIEPKDWNIHLGGDSSHVDFTKFTTRIILNEVEKYQQTERSCTASMNYGTCNEYTTNRKRVVANDNNPKTIKIKATSGDGDDTFLLGSGSHEIDAGGGDNLIDYSAMNDKSSISIKKSENSTDDKLVLLVNKTINGQVYEEFVGKQPIYQGSKKYDAHFRGVREKEVTNWLTEDKLTNINKIHLGKSNNQVDLSGLKQSIEIQSNGVNNDIKLGEGSDKVIINPIDKVFFSGASPSSENLISINRIRTRGGKDHIVIALKQRGQWSRNYDENFICGGTDLDAQGKPTDYQTSDILEYAIIGDYGKDSHLWEHVIAKIGKPKTTNPDQWKDLEKLKKADPNWWKKFNATKKYKFGEEKHMKNLYGDRASLASQFISTKTFIGSQYGVKVAWQSQENIDKDLGLNHHFYKDLSVHDGYLKIERFAPTINDQKSVYSKFYKSLVDPKQLVGTDYAVHINTLLLTKDDDEVTIQDTSGEHALTIQTGQGYDQINLGKGFYTIHTGTGTKQIKLGDGLNHINHIIDELEDTLEASPGGTNSISFNHNLDQTDVGKRVISLHTRDTAYLSNLGIQLDLKAQKSYYYFKDEYFDTLTAANEGYGSNLQNIQDEKTASIKTKYGIGDKIAGFKNINGTKLNDIILGDQQANTINTGDGEDQVNARQGDDIIRLGKGADKGYGGSGDDTFIQDYDNAADTLDGGTGHNTVDYSKTELPDSTSDSTKGLTINLETGLAHLSQETISDLLVNIQHAIGTKRDDTFIGNKQDNCFEGIAGKNTYETKGGTNKLYGGIDQDIYIGGKDGGTDIINDSGGKQDRYRMNMIIDQNKSFIAREDNDLIMKFNDGAKVVKVVGQFDRQNSNRGIEYLESIDGRTYSMAHLLGSVTSGSNQSFNNLGIDWTETHGNNHTLMSSTLLGV